MDYKSLTTPAACVADFCLVPIGTLTASVSEEVAAVQRVMKASGLSYSMHSAGTTVEGSWDAVMRLIGQAHTLVHQNGVVRIQSDIRIGTRTDKSQTFAQKVSKVQSILAADSSSDSSAPTTAAPTATTSSAAPTSAERLAAVPIDAEGNCGKGDTVPLTRGEETTKKATWASMFKK